MRKLTRFRSSWHWLLDGNTTMYIMLHATYTDSIIKIIKKTDSRYNNSTIKIIVHFDVIWCHISFVALYFFLYSKSNKMTSHIRSLTLELAEDIGFVYRIRCFCWIWPIKHRKDICHYNLEGKINRVFSFKRTTRKDKKLWALFTLIADIQFLKKNLFFCIWSPIFDSLK